MQSLKKAILLNHILKNMIMHREVISYMALLYEMCEDIDNLAEDNFHCHTSVGKDFKKMLI